MARILSKRGRPDLDAAERGGDWSKRMDGEVLPGEATLKQALYWRDIYAEVYAMEEKVVARVEQLMEKQCRCSPTRGRAHKRTGRGRPGRAFPPTLGLLGREGAGPPRSLTTETIAPRGFIGIRASSRTLSVGRTPDKRLGEAI